MRRNKLLSDILGEENVITPSDLYNPRLTQATVGGYKRSEVDALLKRVADVLETLISQIRELKSKTEEQQERLDEYRQMETTLRSALVSSQHFGENIVAAAKREAEAILEEARAHRTQILCEAQRLPETLASNISALDQQRGRLRAEILSILAAHRRLLDALIPEPSAEKPFGFFDSGMFDNDSSSAKKPGTLGDAVQDKRDAADVPPASGDETSRETTGFTEQTEEACVRTEMAVKDQESCPDILPEESAEESSDIPEKAE